MTADDYELLSRLADTVRSQIAPAVDDEYARTQAFMAAVILQRLAKQAQFFDEHRAAEFSDVAALADQLDAAFAAAGPAPGAQAHVPADVRDAVARMRRLSSIAAVSEVLEALYRWGPDGPVAAPALDTIRQVLRRDIDRRMEIAR